jgi:hypothetical protein
LQFVIETENVASKEAFGELLMEQQIDDLGIVVRVHGQ